MAENTTNPSGRGDGPDSMRSLDAALAQRSRIGDAVSPDVSAVMKRGQRHRARTRAATGALAALSLVAGGWVVAAALEPGSVEVAAIDDGSYGPGAALGYPDATEEQLASAAPLKHWTETLSIDGVGEWTSNFASGFGVYGPYGPDGEAAMWRTPPECVVGSVRSSDSTHDEADALAEVWRGPNEVRRPSAIDESPGLDMSVFFEPPPDGDQTQIVLISHGVGLDAPPVSETPNTKVLGWVSSTPRSTMIALEHRGDTASAGDIQVLSAEGEKLVAPRLTSPCIAADPPGAPGVDIADAASALSSIDGHPSAFSRLSDELDGAVADAAVVETRSFAGAGGVRQWVLFASRDRDAKPDLSSDYFPQYWAEIEQVAGSWAITKESRCVLMVLVEGVCAPVAPEANVDESSEDRLVSPAPVERWSESVEVDRDGMSPVVVNFSTGYGVYGPFGANGEAAMWRTPRSCVVSSVFRFGPAYDGDVGIETYSANPLNVPIIHSAEVELQVPAAGGGASTVVVYGFGTALRSAPVPVDSSGRVLAWKSSTDRSAVAVVEYPGGDDESRRLGLVDAEGVPIEAPSPADECIAPLVSGTPGVGDGEATEAVEPLTGAAMRAGVSSTKTAPDVVETVAVKNPEGIAQWVRIRTVWQGLPEVEELFEYWVEIEQRDGVWAMTEESRCVLLATIDDSCRLNG